MSVNDLTFEQKDSSQETIVSLTGYVHFLSHCVLESQNFHLEPSRVSRSSPLVYSLNLSLEPDFGIELKG